MRRDREAVFANELSTRNPFVTPGQTREARLRAGDPGTYQFSQEHFSKWMDARIKSGHDGGTCCAIPPQTPRADIPAHKAAR
jgi:hypothetical protein